jgi:hypothetical protein
LGQACSGSKSEDIGGVSLPVVRPVLGVKPKITLIGPLHSAILVELSDDALATLRESLSNVVRDAEADAGDVLVGPAPPVGTPRSCGAPSPGDHLHPRFEGKWELITDAAGGKPCSLRPLSSGAATGVRTVVRTRWTVGP